MYVPEFNCFMRRLIHESAGKPPSIHAIMNSYTGVVETIDGKEGVLPTGRSWYIHLGAGSYRVSLKNTLKGPLLCLGKRVQGRDEMHDYW